MACQDCNDSNITLTGSWFPGSPCIENTDCNGTSYNSACVYYNGPNLPCSGINTLDSLELALQKIDEQICAAIGDYSTYEMNCLPTWWGEAITTESEFVAAITAYVCDLNDTVDGFITATFVDYQTSVDSRFDAIEFPNITCVAASVVSTDSLGTVLSKYCTKFGTIDSYIDVSAVVWNNCLTVVGTPANVGQGLQTLADQICIVYNLIGSGGILPVFNNYSSCIGGTSNDSLVTTIGLIKTRLCLSPTFDNDNLTSSCIVIPAADGDLEGLLQNMLNTIDGLQQNYITFDGSDFSVVATSGDPCDGVTVSLATPLNQDRFVAVNALDSSPSTLVAKLTSAGSIVFDDSSNVDISIDISDGDKGDIIVTSSGTVWTIGNEAITLAKIQDAAGNSKLLGSGAAGSGSPYSELTIGSHLVFSGTTVNTYGRTLIGITRFTSSSTWSKPTGCTAVLVLTVGGGGGGGGTDSAANCSVAGGGGSGGHSWNFITSGLGSSESITIGAGGAGGVGNSNGANGGNTTFGAHVQVNGGTGGITLVEGTSGAFANGGFAGLVTITGSSTIVHGGAGEDGRIGVRLSGTAGISGKGASSFLGGGGNGYSMGSGGDGALVAIGAATNTGNPGTGGSIIVYEYS